MSFWVICGFGCFGCWLSGGSLKSRMRRRRLRKPDQNLGLPWVSVVGLWVGYLVCSTAERTVSSFVLPCTSVSSVRDFDSSLTDVADYISAAVSSVFRPPPEFYLPSAAPLGDRKWKTPTFASAHFEIRCPPWFSYLARWHDLLQSWSFHSCCGRWDMCFWRAHSYLWTSSNRNCFLLNGCCLWSSGLHWLGLGREFRIRCMRRRWSGRCLLRNFDLSYVLMCDKRAFSSFSWFWKSAARELSSMTLGLPALSSYSISACW